MPRSRSPSPTSNLRSPTNSSHSSDVGSSPADSGENTPYHHHTLEFYGQRTLSPHANPTATSSSSLHATRDSQRERIGELATAEGDDEDAEEPTNIVLGPGEEKKKRTRTLTTPYQSAVLHALLAQSRFPTTQMREEVGRSIGLSARKVQIWFQNQRQKAKRNAQGQTATTTAPATGPSNLLTLGNEGSSGSVTDPVAHALSQGLALVTGGHDVGGSSGSQLLGPGTPGAALSPSEEVHASGMPAFADPYVDVPPSRSGRPLTRSGIGSHASWQHHRGSSLTAMRSAYVALPPLLTDDHAAPSTSSGLQPTRRPGSSSMPYSLPPLSMSSPTSTLGYPRIPASPPLDTPFAHRLPDLPPLPGFLHSTTHLGLPPPFTLEPAPQWDPDSFSPYGRRPTSSHHTPSFSFPRAETFNAPSPTISYHPSFDRSPRRSSHVPPSRESVRHDLMHIPSGMVAPSIFRRSRSPEDVIEDDSDEDSQLKGVSGTTTGRSPH